MASTFAKFELLHDTGTSVWFVNDVSDSAYGGDC